MTIYERKNELGGIFVHGIPDFRLNLEVAKKTIDNILELGIKVEYNCELGKDIELENICEKYDAVFLGIGANKACKMNIAGEELDGVYGGNGLLEYKNFPDIEGKNVSIIGGGNVAMDCARTIKRLGAKEVKVIYRRAREQMPAEEKEIDEAIKEGIKFLYQHNSVKIIGNEKVEKVELIKTELVQKDGETRLVPVNIENSNYEIQMDYVIMALGSETEEVVKKLGLNLNKWGTILIDESY